MRLQWRLIRHHRRPIFHPPPTSPFSLPPLHNPTSNSTPLHQSCFCTSSSNPPSSSPSCAPNSGGVMSWLFTSSDRHISRAKALLSWKVSTLRDELVNVNGDSTKVYELLELIGLPLFSDYFDGSALVELLGQLYDFPSLALEEHVTPTSWVCTIPPKIAVGKIFQCC